MAAMASCKQTHLLCHAPGGRHCLPPSLRPRRGFALPCSPSPEQSRRLRRLSTTPSATSRSFDDKASPQNPPPRRRRKPHLPPEIEELATPLPEPPNYLLLAAGFSLAYVTRHAIFAELVEWGAIAAIMGLTFVRFVHRNLRALFIQALQFLHAPLAFLFTLLGGAWIFMTELYTLIVQTVSVRQTLKSIFLVTFVLSLGEATKADSVSSQPWTLLFVTLLGIGAVSEVLHPVIYVFLLLLSVGFSLVVRKKDAVSAFLPATALLVAIAHPLVKAVAMTAFLGLAVYTHWKRPEEQLAVNGKTLVQPTILVAAAVAVGIVLVARYLAAWQLLYIGK